MNKYDSEKFAFFGSSTFSIMILDHLKEAGKFPALVVTVPDRPQGRKMIVTPPPAKLWAIQNNIPFLQPESLSDSGFIGQLSKVNCQLFIVASYGKIIPKAILEIPQKGTLNVHPSLLPKFRGASPIQSAILADMKTTGVTIMLMDEKMDHGPIVAQQRLEFPNPKHQIPDKPQITNSNDQTEIKLEWPPRVSELEKVLAQKGGELLVEAMPKWLAGEIKPVPQNDSEATYCGKMEKSDALIDLNGDQYKNFLKFQAYEDWPGVYFVTERNAKKIRVIVKGAKFENGRFIITRVLPEDKKEISYEEFLRGLRVKK